MAPRKSRRKFVALVLVFCVLVVVAVAGFMISRTLDVSPYRNEIAAALTKATGRKFEIGGQVEVRFSLSPTITAHDITYANAAWGQPRNMLKLERLSASFVLWRLIFGKFEIKRIVFADGDLYLETDDKGQHNWNIENADDVVHDADEYIDIRYHSFVDARIQNVDVIYRGGSGKETSIKIDTLDLSATGSEQDLALDFDGAVNDMPLTLKIDTGPLQSVSRGEPVPLTGQAKFAEAELTVKGRAEDLIGWTGIEGAINLTAPEIANVMKPFGLTIPDLGQFDLAGKVASRTTGGSDLSLVASLPKKDAKFSLDGWVDDLDTFENFDLKIDLSAPEASDITELFGFRFEQIGAVTVSTDLKGSPAVIAAEKLDVRLGRSDLKADLKYERKDVAKITIDVDGGVVDFTPFLPEIDEEVEATPAEERMEGQIFSDEPLPFDALGLIDVDLDVNINRLLFRDAQVDLFHTKLDLKSGVLRIDPLEIEYRKAKATARLTADGRAPPAIDVDLLLQDFDLGRLLKETHVTDLITGDIDVGIDVSGEGGSLHTIVGTLRGHAAFVMGQGDIASKYIDLIAVDLTKFLMPWRKNVAEAKIVCALGQFEIDNGVAATKSLLFDTKEMTMSGKGTINLGSEKVNILLNPRPKDLSLVSLATPLRVSGTLSKLSVGVDTLSAVGKVAEGIAGTLLLGPAGILVPFASLGAGHHHPCVNDLQKTFGANVAKEIKHQPE
jgi:uncharacterized protein involved in outer membrane biogenesis